MGSRTGKSTKTTKTETVSTAGVPTMKEIESARSAIEVKVGDQTLVASKRQFQSGKFGYFVSGKVVIDGLKCQVSGSIVMVKSDQAK